ncbi:MAG: glycerol kinase GlpK, partial [Thermomicrobiales bacterium]
RSGHVRGVGQRPTTSTFPQPGHVHQDPVEIWETTLASILEAIGRSGDRHQDIEAIGIVNQRETTVVWDRTTGKPLAPAIVWQSRESDAWVDAIRQRGREGDYQRMTGLVPDAYFSATKLAMLFDNDPELRQRALAGEVLFGTIDTWLLWNLTGGRVHATDVTNASRTMLFDIRERSWSQSLLDDLGIHASILPDVRASSGSFGVIDADILPLDAPILGMAGDQHAALFGQACFARGDVKCTFGTGAFMLMNTGGEPIDSSHGLLTTVAWQIPSGVRYALEGSVFIAGAAVQWLRDGLGIIETSGEVEALARSVPDSDGVVFVPALVGLGAPHWDSSARGSIFGITRGTTSAHIARATLDAIAFQVTDVLTAMRQDSGLTLAEIRIDGGAAGNDLLAQTLADLLGLPVVRPEQLETTALGAVFLAGLAAGVWRNEGELAEIWKAEARFEPSIGEEERASRLERWHDAVDRSRRWV